MNDRTKDWISIGVLIFQSVGMIWYVSQTVQRLEDRLNVLEAQQTISRGIEDKLNAAREEATTFAATTNLKLTDLGEKMNAVLEVLQQQAVPPEGGTQSAPPNFPRHPGG